MNGMGQGSAANAILHSIGALPAVATLRPMSTGRVGAAKQMGIVRKP